MSSLGEGGKGGRLSSAWPEARGERPEAMGRVFWGKAGGGTQRVREIAEGGGIRIRVFGLFLGFFGVYIVDIGAVRVFFGLIPRNRKPFGFGFLQKSKPRADLKNVKTASSGRVGSVLQTVQIFRLFFSALTIVDLLSFYYKFLKKTSFSDGNPDENSNNRISRKRPAGYCCSITSNSILLLYWSTVR